MPTKPKPEVRAYLGKKARKGKPTRRSSVSDALNPMGKHLCLNVMPVVPGLLDADEPFRDFIIFHLVKKHGAEVRRLVKLFDTGKHRLQANQEETVNA